MSPRRTNSSSGISSPWHGTSPNNRGVAENGYRLLINCNGDAGQEIFHLHMHLFAGHRLGPMVVRRK